MPVETNRTCKAAPLNNTPIFPASSYEYFQVGPEPGDWQLNQGLGFNNLSVGVLNNAAKIRLGKPLKSVHART